VCVTVCVCVCVRARMHAHLHRTVGGKAQAPRTCAQVNASKLIRAAHPRRVKLAPLEQRIERRQRLRHVAGNDLVARLVGTFHRVHHLGAGGGIRLRTRKEALLARVHDALKVPLCAAAPLARWPLDLDRRLAAPVAVFRRLAEPACACLWRRAGARCVDSCMLLLRWRPSSRIKRFNEVLGRLDQAAPQPLPDVLAQLGHRGWPRPSLSLYKLLLSPVVSARKPGDCKPWGKLVT